MLTINDTQFDEATVDANYGQSYFAFEQSDIDNLTAGDVIDAQSWEEGLVHFFVASTRIVKIDWQLRNELLSTTTLVRAALARKAG